MSSKVFGFIGIESYDLVHALGSVITALGCNAILVDNSEDGALACTVPYGMDNGTVVNYYGVDVARFIDADEFRDEYEYIILYLGADCEDGSAQDCDEVYLVTDYQKHNIQKLLNVSLKDEQCRYLIYRDRIAAKIDLSYLQEVLSPLGINDETSYMITESQNDYDNMVMLQYDSVVPKFSVSQSAQELITDILNVDFNSKNILAAIKSLSRRK
ncbi:hypothetical protein AALB53_09120 [Lachnospiraceae bacterium 47-T17]